MLCVEYFFKYNHYCHKCGKKSEFSDCLLQALYFVNDAKLLEIEEKRNLAFEKLRDNNMEHYL